jgi:hypothetical protein
MIISRAYARTLIRQGRAVMAGHTTTAPSWGERYNSGHIYAILDRVDLPEYRTDHCLDNEETIQS